VGWLASLTLLLRVGPVPSLAAVPTLLPLILLRGFLQTGLFIVAHDAMHRSLFPACPRLNDVIGRLALFLYACLPYRSCRRQHLRHHRRPGQPGDPDFHDGSGHDPLRWYAGFMARYLSPAQLGVLLGLWGSTALLLGGPQQATWLRLLGYWILPLVLSSIQLFLFGTYLPHRHAGRPASHHGPMVISSGLPPWLALLTCYYFGYHREHHDHPDVPWHQLPRLRSVPSQR
jgi:beta-carotene ketolase (CrtW type)